MAQIYGALMLGLLPGGALGPIFAATIYDALGIPRQATWPDMDGRPHHIYLGKRIEGIYL